MKTWVKRQSSGEESPGGQRGTCSRGQCVRPKHQPFCSGLSSRDLTIEGKKGRRRMG